MISGDLREFADHPVKVISLVSLVPAESLDECLSVGSSPGDVRFLERVYEECLGLFDLDLHCRRHPQGFLLRCELYQPVAGEGDDALGEFLGVDLIVTEAFHLIFASIS